MEIKKIILKPSIQVGEITISTRVGDINATFEIENNVVSYQFENELYKELTDVESEDLSNLMSIQLIRDVIKN